MEDTQKFLHKTNEYFQKYIEKHPCMCGCVNKETMKDLEFKLNKYLIPPEFDYVIKTLQALSYTNLLETINYLNKVNLKGVSLIINGHALASVCKVEDVIFIGKREDGKYYVEKNKCKRKATKSNRPRLFTVIPRNLTDQNLSKRYGALSNESSTSESSIEKKLIEWVDS